jgi:hypothetical protein
MHYKAAQIKLYFVGSAFRHVVAVGEKLLADALSELEARVFWRGATHLPTRATPGVMPITRLNVRLKAASDV